MIPNEYQTKIYDEIKNGNRNIVVQAKAGTGKTVTIVQAMNYVPANKSVAFLAFNKHIATALADKAPKNAKVATIHSMGLSALRSHIGKFKVNNSKLYYALKDYTEVMRDAQQRIQWGLKVIPLLKANLLEPTKEHIDQICAHHSLDFPDDYNVQMARYVIAAGEKRTNMIDFDDMIWMPIVKNIECKKYDYVFVDEAQDLTSANLELIFKFGHEKTRFVFVGDGSQALYGFRGSYINAMDMIVNRSNAIELPLSICYRCPQKHIELAQTIVPEIKCAPDAPEGDIVEVTADRLMDYVSPNDLCICRNNAPLVAPAFNLLRAGIKVCIRGKDIGKGLTTLIKSFKTNDISKMQFKLSKWYAEEVQKCHIKNLNPDNIEDKYDTIMSFIEACDPNNVDDLVDFIDNIFDDKRSQVTFSSIHRAKGLEADNVFIIQPHLMPSKYAQQDWEIQQEENIRYVAYTRAKNNLYMVM
jgi:DNA helicase-2/ATP-dependent DNA helicase PcrA